MTAQSPATSWIGEAGLGYARIIFASGVAKAGDEIRVVLSDLQPPVEMERSYRDAPRRARLVLPDPRMQASMNAQITHLMMSLVDDETRPGDPALFYRAWHRQGAYITAALARGDPKVGRVLSRFLATHDFAGGSGPEADPPGLTI